MVISPQQNASTEGGVLIQALIQSVTERISRTVFFGKLSEELRGLFAFDRLCINLYDSANNMLSLFTAAEGIGISSLSQVRVAGENTVAGHVIRSRKPIVIMDLAKYFPEGAPHPMAEVGIATTMAFPLIVYDELLGTFHCSFSKEPEDPYQIMGLLLEIMPTVAMCLAVILDKKRLDGEDSLRVRPEMTGPAVREHVYESGLMRKLMHQAAEIARLDVPVLILGETGTGKSMLAQFIHRRSQRIDKNFVKVNCPALVASLFESELFGHAKGAFTGAVGKRVGRFELAHEGTLFLDEIGDLSTEMQTKLLQVLEDQSFERVGESHSISVNVRLITATNVVVAEAMREKRLRSDLFYRIAGVVLHIPALRNRPEDILPLVDHFSAQLSTNHGGQALHIPAAGRRMLMDYPWPGNVRELRNVVNRLLVQNAINQGLSADDVDQVLRVSLSPEVCGLGESLPPVPQPDHPAVMSSSEPVRVESLKDAERRHILAALAACKGVVAGPEGAARLLGLPRSTLQHKLRKLGIVPE